MGTLGTAFWVETGAALLGIWGVWDLGGGRRRGYISGVLSTSAYVVLCAIHGIYADAVINGWYTVMGFVGWFAWGQRKTENGGVPVRTMDVQGFWAGVGSGFLAWVWVWFLLRFYTDSTVVVWDATTSALAITAMLWMAAGYTWNWPLWLIINMLSVGLYIHKGMLPTAGQYTVFAILALRGWWIWSRARLVLTEERDESLLL
jgi:nicotinamide mononucleotide transporter